MDYTDTERLKKVYALQQYLETHIASNTSHRVKGEQGQEGCVPANALVPRYFINTNTLGNVKRAALTLILVMLDSDSSASTTASI